MDAAAKITAKSQLTLPRAVREALGVGPGDSIIFHVDEDGIRVSRIPDLDGLAGAVRVPAGKRGTPWDDILRQTRAVRGRARR